MLVIIDYGMGNIGSILNMLKKIGSKAIVSSNISDIFKAEKIILPGVGAFDNGIKNLKDRNLLDILNDRVINHKIPILGICLGMQLMGLSSEEGRLHGIGWIDAKVIKFNFDKLSEKLKIPHMGWNSIKYKKNSNLVANMYVDPKFYFVHSYYIKCLHHEDILTTTDYGFNFVSAFEKDNIIGVQFHPEKSHKYGMKILKNFIEYY